MAPIQVSEVLSLTQMEDHRAELKLVPSGSLVKSWFTLGGTDLEECPYISG